MLTSRSAISIFVVQDTYSKIIYPTTQTSGYSNQNYILQSQNILEENVIPRLQTIHFESVRQEEDMDRITTTFLISILCSICKEFSFFLVLSKCMPKILFGALSRHCQGSKFGGRPQLYAPAVNGRRAALDLSEIVYKIEKC